MILQNHSRLVLLFATCLFFMGSLSQANATPRLRGDVYVHDPSTVVECDGRHYVFYTRRNIGINHSDDGIHWISAGQVFNQPPSWTYEAVPEFGGSFWAPDIIYSGGRYLPLLFGFELGQPSLGYRSGNQCHAQPGRSRLSMDRPGASDSITCREPLQLHRSQPATD